MQCFEFFQIFEISPASSGSASETPTSPMWKSTPPPLPTVSPSTKSWINYWNQEISVAQAHILEVNVISAFINLWQFVIAQATTSIFSSVDHATELYQKIPYVNLRCWGNNQPLTRNLMLIFQVKLTLFALIFREP